MSTKIQVSRGFMGKLLHRFSDRLHLWAHALIGDPDWRARNGEPYVVVSESTGEQFVYDRHVPKGTQQ